MRVRILQLAFLIGLLLASNTPVSVASPPADRSVVFAQDEGTDSDQGEGADQSGEGQKDPEAETDPGAGEDAEATEEEGPPWTYQMARISIGLILLLGAGIALLYRRLIGSRQKARA